MEYSFLAGLDAETLKAELLAFLDLRDDEVYIFHGIL